MAIWDINLDVSFKVRADSRDAALLKLQFVALHPSMIHPDISESKPAEILFVGDEDGNSFDFACADFDRCVEAIERGED